VILADTSVWVEHLRQRDDRLADLLDREQVTCHPFVIGELALGSLKRRTEILALLARLPIAPVVRDDEVLTLVEQRRLFGTGLGWVDVHLLASAVVTRIPLSTRDRRLASVARALGVSALQS
jgi:predicted nucleic acid-binding protein